VCGSAGARRVIFSQRFFDGSLGDEFGIAICAACGAGFAEAAVSQQALDRYYAEQSKYAFESTGGSESEFDSRRFDSLVERVRPLIGSSSSRILDMGCANGGLLAAFKRRGFSNLLGCDPSPACALAAERIHGVEVRVGTMAQAAGWGERYDLITLVGVLEHIKEVRVALTTLGGLLAPRGIVFVAVPSVEGFAGCRNAPFQQFSMEHLNFFSVKSLNRLMAASGFAALENGHEVVEWRKGITEPVLYGAFTGSPAEGVGFDDLTGPALERYVAVSRAGDARIFAMLSRLAEDRQPLVVWGVGALTRRLMAASPLADANITGFVDSNTHVQGQLFCGQRVLAPGQLAGTGTRILICSVAFQSEITELIRGKLGLGNEIVTIPS
jgi:2-polyprenyl-3-methyl-5-hydroxy-6-metoxy-1,4-benzoquinol methylase